jgi:hypothetical protein
VTDRFGHGWRARYQSPRHARSRMPSGHCFRVVPGGYWASPRRVTVQTPARACWAKGSDRRGGQADVSRSLANGWIPWVLVDNKSVAEIGEKHLAWRGSRSLRRERHAVREHESASHHRDGREAGACGKGVRAVRSFTNQFMTRRHPGPWSGSIQSKAS